MPSVDLSVGAVELGTLFSSILYGIGCVQVYLYTERGFNDTLWIRIMVALVWLFETIHTVLIWVLLYSLTVTNYGKPSVINETPLSLAIALPVTSFLGSMVQVFFASRVHRLSGRLIIPIIAWIGAVLRCAFGITLGVVFFNSHSIPVFFENYQWLVTAQFTLSAAIDILNTSSLCFYLLRRRTGFKATQRLVDKLVMYTVETGLITSLCALAVLILSLVLPHTLVDIGVFMVYPKLFSNSFFTALNARQSLRKTAMDTAHVWSNSVIPQPRSDTENNTVALPLSPRQADFSKSIPSQSLPPSSGSFEEGTRKIIAFSGLLEARH